MTDESWPAREADKRYTEGTFVGSRTDRGTIYVLHGDPDHSEFEQHRNPPAQQGRGSHHPSPADEIEKSGPGIRHLP